MNKVQQIKKNQPPDYEPKRFESEQDLEQRTGIKRCTWQRYRWNGEGPAFYKIGSRCVYDSFEVDQWLASKKINSTVKREDLKSCRDQG